MFGIMEAMLSFLRRQVGLRTDSASASGSLHAKVADAKSAIIALPNSAAPIVAAASGTLRASANTERDLFNTETYTKIKEFQANITGVIRVSFDIKRSGTNTSPVYARIYKNGNAVGTERSTTSETYVTFTQDLPFTKGDMIQIYVKTQASQSVISIRNVRLYWDYSSNTNVILD